MRTFFTITCLTVVLNHCFSAAAATSITIHAREKHTRSSEDVGYTPRTDETKHSAQQTIPQPHAGMVHSANIYKDYLRILTRQTAKPAPAGLPVLPVLYAWIAAIEENVVELEPPIQIRIIAGAEIMVWDVYAPFTDSSVALFSGGKLRLPPEMRTESNLALALMHGWIRFNEFMMPYYADIWQAIPKQFNVTLERDNVDPTTAAGVGNLASQSLIDAFANDGFNQLGDKTPDGGFVNGNNWNRWNYSDYTGYVPANSAYKLMNPTKWQPLIIEPVPPYGGGGVAATGAPYEQVHIVPQAGRALRLTYKGDLTAVYNIPAPADSLNATSAAYKAQADNVLAVSAALTDTDKMQAQHFDDKFTSLAVPILFMVGAKDLNADLSQLMFTILAKGLALYDSNAEAWGQKVRFNAIRPISVIRYLYKNKTVSAWGGPYRGTQSLTGNGYRSYLKTMQHAEYPSGSACYCSALMNTFQNIWGNDVFGLNYTYPTGSSVMEPGAVPAQNITLFWPTFSSYNEQCARSRVLGGVHFTPSTVEALNLCAPIGKAAVMRAQGLADGTDAGPIPIAMLKS